MEETICHIDLDSFFVSVERLKNPELIGKPLLIGGISGRGVVASCSYETRAYGVHSAMPMQTARKLCPSAIILNCDGEAYSKYSAMVTQIISDSAPLFEKASIDEFYMDLTGMDRFFGCEKWAQELRAKITRETGLPISAAMAKNKTVSKIATGEAKPNGWKMIPYGEEKNFLAPLPVQKLPMVGKVTHKLLNDLGIYTIGQIQQMQPEKLQQSLGSNGMVLWQKANALDRSPIEPYSERKSISSEHTFDVDTADVQNLHSLMLGMTEKLSYKLRKEEKMTSCVTVKIRYSDFQTTTMQKKIPYTAQDHVLINVIDHLFEKCFNRRQLIRLIGIRFSGLVYANHQLRLFDEAEKHIHLTMAMDKIRGKFGLGAITRANSLKRDGEE